MKVRNSVIEGIRKHGLARNFFLELKGRVAAGKGLTAREWDWYTARQKEWEPEPFDANTADGPSANPDFAQVLKFLESIEGDGYGGMAEFETARETMRRAERNSHD